MDRNDYIAHCTAYSLKYILMPFYNIEFRNTERLNPLAGSGFIMLPKHQRFLDIPLEGILLKYSINRIGYYFMRPLLFNGFFEILGGIKITRAKDLKKQIRKLGRVQDKERRNQLKREYMKNAEDRKNQMLGAIKYLIDSNEIVIIHPEGLRNYKKPVQIPSANIEQLLQVQGQLGYQIPFVPLDIDYIGRETSLRSKVIVSVGNPIRVPDDGLEQLMAHLAIEVELFIENCRFNTSDFSPTIFNSKKLA